MPTPGGKLTEYRDSHGDPDGRLQAMIDRLSNKNGGSDDDYPTPMDVAMLGWTPGATTWPGRDVMLGSHWFGRKHLVPPAKPADTSIKTRK